MTETKFQRKIATVVVERCNDACVDLFLSKCNIIFYVNIETDPVKAPSSASELLGRVTVEISFHNGTIVEPTIFLEFLTTCLSSMSAQDMQCRISEDELGIAFCYI